MDRNSSSNYMNMSAMHYLISEEMEDAEVADNIEDKFSMGWYGSISRDKDDFECKCNNKRKHPGLCIVFHDRGRNTSQKGYEHIGGEIFLCKHGTISQ